MHLPRLLLRTAAGAALVAVLAMHAGAAPMAESGLNPADFDTTCNACDDFWRYATGGWRKHHAIPPGELSYGTFEEIYNRNLVTERRILERAAADTAADPASDEHRIGSFYAACTDLTSIESDGFVAMQPEFDRINAIATVPQLVAEVGRLERLGVDVGLGFSSEADKRDSSRTIGAVGYGGLGMPDRDYYLAPQYAAIRTAYARYLKTLFGLAGDEPGLTGRQASAVFALETTLAKATPPDADLRDPLATYHPTAVSRLTTIAPHVPWRAYFAAMDHPALTSVDLNLPKFTAVYDAQLASVPIATWQAYLRSHLLTAFADALPKRFERTSFAFYSTVINGIKQQRPRWKRCIDLTDTALPDPLGKVYVAQVFPPSAKGRVLALVNDLQATLHDDIATLPWMSPATRKYAEIKLAAYTKKIGYPDHWIDYSAVTFAPHESFLADRFATQAFNTQLDLHRIGKPTDRTLWGLSAPTVNAYYNPSNNEIVFPAGILQSPLYDSSADDALIYGASGAIIGHEMTHGFDDQGRKYDAKGDLGNWWTPGDAARFSKRAQCIVDQFNGYFLAKGLHENGRLDQGEAIADLGGATIAFRAFERTAEYRAHVKIGGYTPEQRFFLSYAQIWRGLITPAAARNYALTDPHPDNQFRVLGTLGNMPEFQTAFACARNAPMIRKNRCQIW